MMDYSPPYGLPSPIRPGALPDWWQTPPHLKQRPVPQKPVEFKLRPSLRDIIEHSAPIEFPPSPEPLPEEIEDEFPIATGLPGFAPSPPPTPFELPPSPEKRFERQITPKSRRKGAPRQATPPRERKAPAPGLLAAHRQFQSLLRETRGIQMPGEEEVAEGICPGAAAALSPRRRRSPTTTPERTPPRVIPPPYQDPFLRETDFDLASIPMPQDMELSPEEIMRREIRQAPHRTKRRPIRLYGYGERPAKVLARRQRAPCLGKNNKKYIIIDTFIIQCLPVSIMNSLLTLL